jgi:hypothetical protein
MNLNVKLEFAKTAIRSISRHDDEPTATVVAALRELKDFIDNETDLIEPRKTLAAEAKADAAKKE